jgi:hypothetical protein
MDEVWVPIAGAGMYAVSSFGRVKRIAGGKSTAPGRLLSEKPRNRDRYTPVVLSLGARGKFRRALVHHLVAEAFLGPKPSPLHCVAHNDGNPTNNRADNLRWATHGENMLDMVRHGRTTSGERTSWAVLNEEQVRMLRRARAENRRGSVSALARQMNVNRATASDAASGVTWKHVEI